MTSLLTLDTTIPAQEGRGRKGAGLTKVKDGQHRNKWKKRRQGEDVGVLGNTSGLGNL